MADKTVDGFVASRRRFALGLSRRALCAVRDERLVALIRSRDDLAVRNAFEVLYDRHHRNVLGFCRHMLGSPQDAEDALQQTFSAAYRTLVHDDREIVVLGAWLYVIARHRCLTLLAARREQVALDDVEEVVPSTVGLALEVEQRSDLRELLSDLYRLPHDQRAALILSEFEVHSHKEIAEILGLPQPRIKALVFQARATLMGWREARNVQCTQIRQQLSIRPGGALRHRELRRHVEACADCRAFAAEVRCQRAQLSLLLPVVPTLGLKHSSLAAAFAASTTTASTGVGAITLVAAKATAPKVLALLAAIGGAGGGGYVAVSDVAEVRDVATVAKVAKVTEVAEVSDRDRASAQTSAQTPVQRKGQAPAATAASPVISSAAPDAQAATPAPRPSPPGAPALHAGGSQDAASAQADDREHAGSARDRGSSVKHKSPRQRDALPHGGGARGKPDDGRGGGHGSTARRGPPRRALDERRAGALLAALRKLQRAAHDHALDERRAGALLAALRKLERAAHDHALDERRAGALLAALRKLQREVEDGAPSERSVGEALRALRTPQHTTRPLSHGTG